MFTALSNNIISHLGLNKLSSDKQADLLVRMAEVIQKRIALRVIELLPAESLDEYLEIVDNNEIDAHQFLVNKIPNYAAMIDEEIVKFKKEITS